MIMVPALRPAMSPAMSNRASQTAINFDSLVSMLFAASEPGTWYDPSDMSTLFQDSAGTVPVTAVEQPVGRILDKSGRGNHATQATTTKRPIYSRRVNLLLGSTTLATQSITTLSAAHKLVFSGTGSVTLSGTATGVYGAGVHSITTTAGALTLTVSGSVQDASFHLAVDSHLVYQGINTATDYDADPAKFPAYLRFDGVDDALQTGNIDFTSTDKMTVWAGVTKLSDAVAVILELSDTWTYYSGSFLVFNNAASFTYYSASRGSGAVNPGHNAPIAGEVNTSVLAITHDIPGDLSTIRRNGIPGVNGIVDKGAGSFGNYPLYIGARAGTSYFVNGRLYGLIVRGAQSSLLQIEDTELYMNKKVGIA